MYICICRAVSDRTVKELLAAGADSAHIARTTGAGTVCGTCRPTLAAFVVATCQQGPPRDPGMADSQAPVQQGTTADDGGQV